MEPADTCCCMCWIEGVSSPPIKGWEGVPMCREHLAEVVGKNTAPTHLPRPSPGVVCTTLQ